MFWLSFVFRCRPFCAILYNKCSVVFAHTFAQIQIRSDFECPRRLISVGPGPKQFPSSPPPHTLLSGHAFTGQAWPAHHQIRLWQHHSRPAGCFSNLKSILITIQSSRFWNWFQLGCVSIKHPTVGKKCHNYPI